MMKKINISCFESSKFFKFLFILKINRFCCDQFMNWVHKKGVSNFFFMSNISKVFRYKLYKLCILKFSIIEKEEISNDGTVKWLLKISGNNYIESIFIPEKNRGTLCLSSQVGCFINCSFCNTGLHGFNRNLYSSEIISQLYVIKKRLKFLYNKNVIFFYTITNIVVMGMGEPLVNFNNLSSFLSLIKDKYLYNFSKKCITVSTSGIIPGMHDLVIYNDVSLAVSLHHVDDDIRMKLMPINKKYNINSLFRFFDLYNVLNINKITIEYIMLRNINDQNYHAYKLVKLLSNGFYKVNLIQLNVVKSFLFYPSFFERIYFFQKILKKSGISVMLRKIRGIDINASCGQLMGKFINIKKK